MERTSIFAGISIAIITVESKIRRLDKGPNFYFPASELIEFIDNIFYSRAEGPYLELLS